MGTGMGNGIDNKNREWELDWRVGKEEWDWGIETKNENGNREHGKELRNREWD